MCRSELCALPPPPPCPATAVMPHQLTKSMKPKLPRKLATSARINLNKYWRALEELMPLNRRAFDESDCNAINENMDNERRLAAMQISEPQEDSHHPSTPMIDDFFNGKTDDDSLSKMSMESSSSLTFSSRSPIQKADSDSSLYLSTFDKSSSIKNISESSCFPTFNTSHSLPLDDQKPSCVS